jgi:hypothetical protein
MKRHRYVELLGIHVIFSRLFLGCIRHQKRDYVTSVAASGFTPDTRFIDAELVKNFVIKIGGFLEQKVL